MLAAGITGDVVPGAERRHYGGRHALFQSRSADNMVAAGITGDVVPGAERRNYGSRHALPMVLFQARSADNMVAGRHYPASLSTPQTTMIFYCFF
jgi:hypothetical protein